MKGTRRLAAIVLILFTGACSENDNSDSAPVTARLAVNELPHVPGRYYFDHADTEIADGYELSSYLLEIISTDTGKLVHSETLDNNSRSFMKKSLRRGNYTARLQASVVAIQSDALPDFNVPQQNKSLTTIQENDTALLGKIYQSLAIENFSIDLEDADVTSSTCPDVTYECNVLLSSIIFDSGNYTSSAKFTCALGDTLVETDCYKLDLDDIFDEADPHLKQIGGTIDDATIMIEAYGGSGSRSTSIIGTYGSGGDGGYARTVQTYEGYTESLGSTKVMVLIADDGSHDSSGGTGGASTIVMEGETFSLDNTPILVAGGGGGGSEAAESKYGGDGGAGAFAIPTESNDAYAVGGNGTNKNRDVSTYGGGGSSCDGITEFCGGDGANPGNPGLGGMSGGSGSSGAKGWKNLGDDEDTIVAIIGDSGAGGHGNGTGAESGGGGGGAGGGAGGGDSDNAAGAGGGSYAIKATAVDSSLPSTSELPAHSGRGEFNIVISFTVSE